MNTGLALIKAAAADCQPFTVWHSDDHPNDGYSEAAYTAKYARADKGAADPTYQYNCSTHKAWEEATACCDATIRFDDGSWCYLVHGNSPEETIADFSIKGVAADLVKAVEVGGAA